MSKAGRILSIYSRLLEGKTLIKREEAARFRVDERTIQRDLDDVRAYLADSRHVEYELVYDRARMGYLLRKVTE